MKSTLTEKQRQIVNGLYQALELIDAPMTLLAVVGSWDDTLTEDEVLDLLHGFNKSRKETHHSLAG